MSVEGHPKFSLSTPTPKTAPMARGHHRLALEQFRVHYHDSSITKWDSSTTSTPSCTTPSTASATPPPPRTPPHPPRHLRQFYHSAQDDTREGAKKDANLFRALAAAGQRLAEIHVHYEQQPEFSLTKTEKKGKKLDYRVTKMKLSKDKTTLIYNS
jgi:hypothetical protein